MDLIYRFEGRLGESIAIGPLSDGLRFDNAFEGVITDGELVGGRARGMDYIRLRPDGAWVIDARETIELDGGHVHVAARGYLVPPEGGRAPGTAAPADPGAEPPDVPTPILATALCETGIPRFAHLNTAIATVEGWVNLATGALVFEGRALAPVGAGAAVRVPATP